MLPLLPLLLPLAVAWFAPRPSPESVPVPPNPAIDPVGHRLAVEEAHRHRETRRLTEADFLKMRAEPGTIVLDARSKDKFAMLHVRGAVNLPFSDIDIASLARVLPDKSARILIYCNNNFQNAEESMPSKTASLSLNLSTYTALHASGYRNVYELGPRLDPATTKLPLAGTEAKR